LLKPTKRYSAVRYYWNPHYLWKKSIL